MVRRNQDRMQQCQSKAVRAELRARGTKSMQIVPSVFRDQGVFPMAVADKAGN